MAFENLKKKLEDNGFSVSVFATGEEAAAYLNQVIDGKTVGCGGSMTLKELGLYDSLATHNTLYYHGTSDDPQTAMKNAMTADVYLLSANAIAAESGELISIDGTGNRVASSLFGHRRVYFVVGINKLAPDYDSALWRARNIAAPKNAQRLGRKTPCAIRGDRCYDCRSPQRICRGLMVLWGPMAGTQATEVLLINQELGY